MIIPVERGILDSASLQFCVDALRSGELICYPTETFYALGVDVSNEQALLRLYTLKQRPLEKRTSVDRFRCRNGCNGMSMTADSRFAAFAGRFWPGPLTLVLPSIDRSKSYAIRVSSHPVARQIAQAFGSPLVSTSANRSGEPAVKDSRFLPEPIKQAVAILVEGGVLPGGAPSTIVSLLERPGTVLRQGAISLSEIVSLL